MKPGKLLSLGLLSAMLAACNSGTDTPKGGNVDGRTIAPAINALTKAAATQAGLEMSRVGDEDFNPFDEKMVAAMKEVGICEGFILLAEEIFQSMESDTSFNFATSPRFAEMVECIAGEVQSFTPGKAPSPDAVMGLIDKCLCGSGGGTVFGAIAAYNWSAKYKVPSLSVYKSPSTGNYKSPSLGNYKSPSLGNYKSPAL